MNPMPPKKIASKKASRSRKNGRTAAAKRIIGSPIVGIGGSAGGFEATMDLLRHLPAKSGMTFVVVQHLDPHHASKLASLLGKATTMPVIEIAKTTEPKPNTVYVQPPNKCVVVKDGALRLVPRTRQLNVAIDQFFESLAEACASRAIGVLLSGSGSDGTAGLRAIKAAGGLTFAQDKETAKFPEMPRSAIRSGFVDAVHSPRGIAREIRHLVEHPYVHRVITDREVDEAAKSEYEKEDDLGRIFPSLKKQMGDLLVRRVTPAARSAFNILQSDVGRPISDFRPNVDILDLEDLLREVIETLALRDRRVSDKQGRQYSLRARPYRTSDNKIDGAVITLVDIDAKAEPDDSKAAKRTK
jgi:hypothetical protein